MSIGSVTESRNLRVLKRESQIREKKFQEDTGSQATGTDLLSMMQRIAALANQVPQAAPQQQSSTQQDHRQLGLLMQQKSRMNQASQGVRGNTGLTTLLTPSNGGFSSKSGIKAAFGLSGDQYQLSGVNFNAGKDANGPAGGPNTGDSFLSQSNSPKANKRFVNPVPLVNR